MKFGARFGRRNSRGMGSVVNMRGMGLELKGRMGKVIMMAMMISI